MIVLIDSKTMLPVRIGSEVTTFRGEKGTLLDLEYPRRNGSSGHVYVRLDGSPQTNYWYPGVIGARFIEEKELKETHASNQAS